ncbi:protein PRRC2C-like [Anopheles aquasalis]|uniref:protein PRRC2C-like n=1 Tax=Anopheles aquasalis TaxID=42839 RepID=UPI00215B2962|nr:protein PRRC2C-like [Anopheles aquasalis]
MINNHTMVHSGALVSHYLLRPLSTAAAAAVALAATVPFLSSALGPSSDPQSEQRPLSLSVTSSLVCERPRASYSSSSSVVLAYRAILNSTSIPVVSEGHFASAVASPSPPLDNSNGSDRDVPKDTSASRAPTPSPLSTKSSCNSDPPTSSLRWSLSSNSVFETLHLNSYHHHHNRGLEHLP